MQVPRFFCGNVVCLVLPLLWFFDIWFLCDTVGIFMKRIQKISSQLLRVMLIISNKLFSMLAKTVLEASRVYDVVVRRRGTYTKHFTQQFSKLSCEFSSGAQWIFKVQIVFILSGHEIFSQRLSMRKTLQRTIHETCIS